MILLVQYHHHLLHHRIGSLAQSLIFFPRRSLSCGMLGFLGLTFITLFIFLHTYLFNFFHIPENLLAININMPHLLNVVVTLSTGIHILGRLRYIIKIVVVMFGRLG